jgi:hypothetical protein
VGGFSGGLAGISVTNYEVEEEAGCDVRGAGAAGSENGCRKFLKVPLIVPPSLTSFSSTNYYFLKVPLIVPPSLTSFSSTNYYFLKVPLIVPPSLTSFSSTNYYFLKVPLIVPLKK